MDEEIYDAIGRYAAGEMEGEELRAFEEKLRTDTVLKEQTALYKSVSGSLSARFRSEAEEKAFRANIARLAEEHIGHAGGSAKLKWYAWAAAASVILCAVIFYSIQSPVPEYSEYAVFEPLALTGRSHADSLKIQAEEAFNGKRYEQALPYFDAILRQEPDNTELRIYKGIALLELGKYAGADALFDSLRTSPSVYSDKALWLRALSALKQKDYETCKTLLKDVSPEAEDYKKAQDILDDLE